MIIAFVGLFIIAIIGIIINGEIKELDEKDRFEIEQMERQAIHNKKGKKVKK